MAQLKTKIQKYCEANSVNEVDFDSDVILHDESDGNGIYIFEWNLDIPQPTDAQLDTYEDSANTQDALDILRNNRKISYPDIAEQLDMQYWDAVNGTTTWKDAIAQVKADNPKPE